MTIYIELFSLVHSKSLSIKTFDLLGVTIPILERKVSMQEYSDFIDNKTY
jgi:hypothetical protein